MSLDWKIGQRLSCSAKDAGCTVVGYIGRFIAEHGALEKRRKRNKEGKK